MITATPIADSTNPYGGRITTMLITFPRIVLAEFNTHRVFSKNTASSRAIPFEKNLKSVIENPFVPIAFQKHHKGMQGNEYFEGKEAEQVKQKWLHSLEVAVESAKSLYEAGVTKQLCNRLIEPFSYVTMLMTSTQWDNFFNLRCPRYEWITDEGESKYFFSKKDWLANVSPDLAEMMKNQPNEVWLKINKGMPEIHMMDLAEKMWDTFNTSVPVLLTEGQWHIPFLDKIGSDFTLPEKLKISTSMCARTSYSVLGDESTMTPERLIEIYDTKLINQDPFHASPFEHCAQCMDSISNFLRNGNSRNFTGGFMQYREIIEMESLPSFNKEDNL